MTPPSPTRLLRTVLPTLFVALIALTAGAARAHDEPGDVTDEQVAGYKQRVADGCRIAGLHRGQSRERVDAYCGCLIKTLDGSMSLREWQQATHFAAVQRERDEVAVLQPHAAKVAACRGPVQPAPRFSL